MKIIHTGTEVKVVKASRVRHAIVVTVTSQSALVVRIGRTTYSVTRETLTGNHGPRFA